MLARRSRKPPTAAPLRRSLPANGRTYTPRLTEKDATTSLNDSRLHRRFETGYGFVDDWAYLTIDERKRLVGTIFETITASEDDLDFAPREGWKAYVRTVIPMGNANESLPFAGRSERKTGLEPATSSLARTRSTN